MWVKNRVFEVLFLGVLSASAQASEGVRETEKEVPLRSVGTLQLTNAYGPVSIQGWSLDRIRIKIRKHWKTQEPVVYARAQPLPAELVKKLDRLDVQIHPQKNRIEVIGSVGSGLGLEEKLKFRKEELPMLELQIRAPSHLALQIFSSHPAGVKVSAWNSNLEVQAKEGTIELNEIASKTALISCESCALSGRALSGVFRVSNRSGSIDLRGVKSEDCFLETQDGAITLRELRGQAQVVSDSGEIRVNRFVGEVEFKTRSGNVHFSEARGSVFGSTETGDVHAEMRDWRAPEKSSIQSDSGSIHLTLPDFFAGELDVGSETGKVHMGFPLMNSREKEVYGPMPPNRFKGVVGNGLGELLKVFSKTGSVWVVRGI